ncbi:M4 family metallopeptidase [Actinoplanes sp. NPDC049265]|uniref:M4 family metallopeptidase n=1 Tax=Actinoplanes sp. NPDC049265 TaxID=3363902 RepID=UPI003721B08A
MIRVRRVLLAGVTVLAAAATYAVAVSTADGATTAAAPVTPRLVCDLANRQTDLEKFTCETKKAARVEGGKPVGVADVNRAYDDLGDFRDFMSRYVGRDSVDGRGMPLRAVVRACDQLGCPQMYWDGRQLVAGEDFVLADDLAGHELTHGVNQFTANFYYGYQSGAIDESMADVFGEFVDQTYKTPGTKDGPAYDWLIGEDTAEWAPVRSMKDPTKAAGTDGYRSPDRMRSPLYFVPAYETGTGEPEDSGGVHYNSGVGNKAAYLITASGAKTFNGQTVTGIGIAKAAKLYYRVLGLLPSAATYTDLADALTTACTQLATAGTGGFTTTDCTQVSRAITATEMRLAPAQAGAALTKPAPICGAGEVRTAVDGDGFEQAARARWTLTGAWHYPPANGHAHGDVKFHANAREGKQALQSYIPYTASTSTVRKSTATWNSTVKVPTGATTYLRFQHDRAMQTEDGKHLGAGYVEYRADGGAWTDASKLFTDNGYTGNLNAASGYGTAKGFTGNTHGYTASRLNLTPLAGHQVQFRFVSVIDKELRLSTWWIDDVRAYTCGPAAGY